MKKSVYLGASLDGYIARLDGSLDWLDKASSLMPEGEDCGYAEFMSSIDLLVMGRNTYEKVRSFGDWPYEKPVTVLSQRYLDIPNELREKINHSRETPEQLCARLEEKGVKRIYVDGAAVVQSFLAKGLITDLTITTIPILIGEGISLFGPLNTDLQLEHMNSKVFDFGFVQNTYLVKN